MQIENRTRAIVKTHACLINTIVQTLCVALVGASLNVGLVADRTYHQIAPCIGTFAFVLVVTFCLRLPRM